VLQALGRIAEVALAFGATAAIEAPDTVWLDVTGSAHLVGGESALVQELCSQVRSMGHVVRVAVASGPLLARAFARWADPPPSEPSQVLEPQGFVIPSARTVEMLAPLPISALPLSPECTAWLMRVGVFTVQDLTALPRSAAAARLGQNASRVLDLCEGRDPTPLVAHVPPRVIQEENIWDDPVSGYEPLRFVLRGLVARLSARLVARGLAAQRLEVSIEQDRSSARLHGVEPVTIQKFKLAAPLWKEEELGRVIGSRLERLKLKAPSIGLRIEVTAVVPAVTRQLDLSQVSGGTTAIKGDDELPVLLAELYADIGQPNVGVLRVLDAHRLESKSGLFGLHDGSAAGQTSSEPEGSRSGTKSKTRERASRVESSAQAPRGITRLLPQPLRFDTALRVGATMAIERRLYTIQRLAFEQRLDTVEWWSEEPISRDYVRLWLEGAEGGLQVLVFVDRHTDARFLQAIAD
jgi:protein ImuB